VAGRIAARARVSRVGDGALDEFKARLPLVDIVGRHVRLVRRGNRHQGLCPFHQEKSPSFYVFEDQGNYHCFGCGAHGNAIDFIMAVEGLPFAEALRRLADLTGIPAPLRDPVGAEARREKIDPLLAANEAARAWFRHQLASPAGKAARDYLVRRGVPPALEERFWLGYAPESRDGLVRALEAQGIAVATQAAAGLVVQPDDGGRAYDRFRHRLMFPIADGRGRLVGFGGRALGDAKAKYLNTPETPLFKKGGLLYALDLASKPARERREIFIVEGYLDVIAMHEAGFPNTIAPLGTAIGEAQLELLWRHSDEPYVCLDGDAAGLAAALRMIRRALPTMKGGQTLRFVVLPSGEDPDSLLRGRGRDALLDLVRSAVPLSMMIWQAEHSAAPVDTPEQLAGLRRRLLEYVRLAADPGFRDGLKARFDDLLYALRRGSGPAGRDGYGRARGVSRTVSLGRVPSGRAGQIGPAGGWEGAGRAELKASIQNTERQPFLVLLGAFLQQPALLDRYADDLDGFTLEGQAEAARREVLNWLAAVDHLDAASLDNHLSRYGFAGLVYEARQVVANLARESDAMGSTLADELDAMLARRRKKRAEAIEREASARVTNDAGMDALAWRRLNELLNGAADDEREW
jgi:DNA primase